MNTEKQNRKYQLELAIEETRRQLRQPGDKLAITMYDYFMLALFVVIMLGDYSYWWFCLAIVWERPAVIAKKLVRRIRQDRELRISIKTMLNEIEAIKKEEKENE